MDALRATDLWRDVHQRAEEINRLLAAFDDEDGWTTVREDGDGNRTQYRAEEDLGTHSFKVEGVIEAPLMRVAACLYEVELFHHWFPMLKQSRELATLSRFHKVAAVEINVPFPFVANRETVCDAYGVNLLEQSKVIIVLKTIDEHPLVDIPPPASGIVRCDIHVGGFLIEPLARGRSRFRMMSNVDPKVSYLPKSMLNWFTQKLIHYIVVFIGQVASKAKADDPEEDDDYDRAIQSNRPVYGFIEEMIRSYFEQHEEEE